ncbi:MAG: fibronectin type III domain-containing protein, partial [Thermoplasmata archaeon]|nr:fibronectin type III domain-containing protein [Thermoplasmata archaeon]
LPDFVRKRPLTISWSPAVDHGIGVSHYEVWWYKQGPPGSSPMVVSIEVIGQSLTFPGLGEGTWIFGISAVDRFGQSGPWSGFNTTVDATPPSAPVMEELHEYSKDWRTTLTWSASTDEGSGVALYRVSYRQGDNSATTVHVDTPDTSVTLLDLEEDVTYWFEVHAFDNVGNSRASNEVHTYFDFSPPSTSEISPIPEFLTETTLDVHWSVAVDEGVGTNEYWLFWRHYEDRFIRCDHGKGGDSGYIDATSYTIEGLEDGTTYCIYVASDDWLNHQSAYSEMIVTTVDLSPPEIFIRDLPNENVVSGLVPVSIMYREANPLRYSVWYHYPTGLDWGIGTEYIVRQMPLPGNTNFTIQWDS